jgi:cation:H+ antiporter
MLFSLFWAQFIIGAAVPESWELAERVGVSAVYLVLGIVIFSRQRALIVPLLRDGFRTPYRRLNAGEEAVGE